MATRIRLQRHGRKARPFYHIVIADARAKRDGRFIEKIGTYNPTTNPATIELNNDKALNWLMTGAQPSDTVRAILSHRGILLHKHLLEGVKKGALTEEQAMAKLEKWMEGKEGAVNAKIAGITSAQDAAKSAALELEKEINKKRAAEVEAKNTPEVEETTEEVASEETPEAEA